MHISAVTVSGLEASMAASGLPMVVDPKDASVSLTRATKLASTDIGSGHDNFLNGITVHFFISASNKFWVEMQRYHFMDFVSSQSTMHRMKSFDLDKAYNEYVDPRIIEIMKELQAKAIETKSAEDELRLLYSNPAGFENGAYMVTNYRQLKTIYAQRRYHRLPEWQIFCDWIETLHHAEFITSGLKTRKFTKLKEEKDV